MSVMLVSTNGGDFLLLLPGRLLVSDEVDIGWKLSVELPEFSLAGLFDVNQDRFLQALFSL